MRSALVCALASLALSHAHAFAQTPPQTPTQQPQQQQTADTRPEFIVKGQQLTREGKLEEALEIYRQELRTSPNSVQAHTAAGVVLDLLGRGAEARQHFAKAVEAAPTPQAKAGAQRRMAMSYAFEGDCRNAVRFQQMVFDYHVAQKNFFQQGEMANEVARICLEAGDIDTAERWYKTGYEVGLKEPDIKPERAALWRFRWEHAQARIAARRGRKDEARRRVVAAKAILDENAEMAKEQAVFFPYLAGYVAFYTGDHQTALTELQRANQDDPFIQSLIAQTYEKLGQQEKALEFYRKAAQATSHNPTAAFARPFARKKLAAK